VVGIIRRRRDVFRCGDFGMPFFADPFDARFLGGLAVINIILGFGHVNLREEGLFLFEVSPVFAGVHGAFRGEIQIELTGADNAFADVGDVGGVITGVFQQMRDGPHTGREPPAVGAMAAHVVHIGGSGVPTGHERGTARRAHGRGGIDFRVPRALASEAVEVGGADVFLAVAGEVEGEVLADNPKDVGGFG